MRNGAECCQFPYSWLFTLTDQFPYSWLFTLTDQFPYSWLVTLTDQFPYSRLVTLTDLFPWTVFTTTEMSNPFNQGLVQSLEDVVFVACVGWTSHKRNYSAITGRCGLCCWCWMNKSQKKLSSTYPLLIFQVLFRTGGVKSMLQWCSFIFWVQWSKGCPLGITQYCAARERKRETVYIHFQTNPAAAVFVLRGHTVAGMIPVFVSSTWIKWSNHLNWVLAAPVSVTWGTL